MNNLPRKRLPRLRLCGMLIATSLLTACASTSYQRPTPPPLGQQKEGVAAPAPALVRQPDAAAAKSVQGILPRGGKPFHPVPVPAPEPVPGLSSAPAAKAVPRAHSTDRSAEIPPAAMGILKTADQMLARNDPDAALAQLERAQRIAPRTPAIYFKIAEGHVRKGQLPQAEQFTLKGIAVAGQDSRAQKAGWLLLADIRRARNNTKGAEQAEANAAALP